ncbi:MAG TPA: dTMP kinase [Firmicutes bacterium]|nr:dTMP kinase [Bacillota bacterium]
MHGQRGDAPEGLFLTFEGPDGAGKSTQARLLRERLQACGREVLLVREPGGTPIGEKMRELLLDPRYTEMTVVCEVFLYSAARTQLVVEQIRPALLRGVVVISDRYSDSTLVYQGLAGGEDLEVIRKINLWATGGLVPRRTFLLDLEAEKGLLRVRRAKRGIRSAGEDRIEQKELVFHRRVRRGFLELAVREQERICVISADTDASSVHARVWEMVIPLLPVDNCQL